MLYWRRTRLESGELLPVSHDLLDYRQRALCHLKILDSRNELVTKVRSLVFAKTVDRDATIPDSNLVVISCTGTEASETTLAQSGPSLILPTNRTSMDTGHSVEHGPPSAHDQSLVEAILVQLRLSFASSRYVQRHAELCRIVKVVETEFEKCRKPRIPWERFNIRLDMAKLLERWQEATDMLDSHSRQFEPGKSVHSGSKRNLYDLIPSHSKAVLEDAVRSWEADPDGHRHSHWDEDIDSLARIALASADWDMFDRETWQLQPVSDKVDRQIGIVKQELRPKETWIKLGDAELGGILRDFPTSVLTKGLYAAPSENPVSRLLHLRDGGSVVYLL